MQYSQLGEAVEMEIEYVYHFSVEGRSSMFVNGFEVCTIGQFLI